VSTGTDVGQGDSELAYLDIGPADNTTQATLTVDKPDGTTATVSVSGGALTVIPDTSPVQYSQRWTSGQPVVYDQAGKTVLHWAVTGTGEGTEDLEVWVVASPVAGGPTWAPGRSRPAAYVPHRTLVRNLASTTESGDGFAWTWDSTTTPPGTTVDRLIADGIAWVASRITPMNTVSHDAASVIVSLYAAAAVERGWPDDDTSLQRANDLEKRMDTLLADLVASNAAANQADGAGTYPPPALPQWSFTRPDLRWDDARYF
jgi:hypothetical protein